MKSPSKFATLQEWQSQLETDYPYAVTVNPPIVISGQMMNVDWLREHVGEPYVDWINEWPTYRFKRESDAVKFSLAFT